MRPVCSWTLAAALLISFSRAPFDHVHLTDPDHLHSHTWHEEAAHEDADASHWEAPDHDADAVFKEWLAGNAPAPSKIAGETPITFVAARVAPAGQVVRPLVPQSHDPPAASLLPARSPPAIS